MERVVVVFSPGNGWVEAVGSSSAAGRHGPRRRPSSIRIVRRHCGDDTTAAALCSAAAPLSQSELQPTANHGSVTATYFQEEARLAVGQLVGDAAAASPSPSGGGGIVDLRNAPRVTPLRRWRLQRPNQEASAPTRGSRRGMGRT